jgi:hypothetical protein
MIKKGTRDIYGERDEKRCQQAGTKLNTYCTCLNKCQSYQIPNLTNAELSDTEVKDTEFIRNKIHQILNSSDIKFCNVEILKLRTLELRNFVNFPVNCH